LPKENEIHTILRRISKRLECNKRQARIVERLYIKKHSCGSVF